MKSESVYHFTIAKLVKYKCPSNRNSPIGYLELLPSARIGALHIQLQTVKEFNLVYQIFFNFFFNFYDFLKKVLVHRAI